MQREIQKMLVASTAHITEADSKLLREACEKDTPLISHSYAYGDFIVLNDIEEKMPEIEKVFSESFCLLLKTAVLEGCTMLRLDCDGPVYPDLPTNDW